jgi:CubicO group peptidase (beta-lactamase class C family)
LSGPIPASDDLAERLRQACLDAHAPGASVTLVCDGETASAAHGLLNLASGVGATMDSLFQVGSITKAFVAVLAMRAVEQGRFDLDAPIDAYLPGLKIGGAPVSQAINARRLLSHTSGIDCDLFVDTGDGDDCLERYMDACTDAAMVCDPGAHYSYSNVGYAILGRALEAALQTPFDTALREQVLDPLGLVRTTTLAERAVAYRCAVGHGWDEETGSARVLPYVKLPRALGPAGFTLMSTSGELAAFGGLFVNAGRSAGGEAVLSPASVAEMTTPQVKLIDGTLWGLGVKLHDWGSTRFVAHAGGTIGQIATLWTSPEHRFVFALVTNGANGSALFRSLLAPILAKTLGAHPPPRPRVLNAAGMDLGRYEGEFQNASARLFFTKAGEGLGLRSEPIGGHRSASLAELLPIGPHRFVWKPQTPLPVIGEFFDFDAEGRPRVFVSGELYRRPAGAAAG